jgi:hypothetical protein
MRACYITKDNFMKHLLCFWSFQNNKKEFCIQVIDQVREFIQLTEKPGLAAYLEHNSDDYYGDIVRILFAEQQKFPLLCELIAEDMREILRTETQTSKQALNLLQLG